MTNPPTIPIVKRFRRMIDRMLENAFIYRISQSVVAPGAARRIAKIAKSLMTDLPEASTLLDVGCGPASILFAFGLKPVGVDLNPQYIAKYQQSGCRAVVASADQLPFENGSFDGVWSCGLFHHLSNEVVQKSLDEMIRVCTPGGYIVVLDAVMPRSVWRRPLAAGIRKLDRGRFVRRQEDWERLLPDRALWKIRRQTYCITGVELVVCTYIHREKVE